MYIYQSWLRCVLLPSRAIYVQPLLKMYTKQLLELVWVWFVLLYDTSSQKRVFTATLTILFLNLQITRSDIRPDIKWAVSLVIAYGLFNLSLSTTFFCDMQAIVESSCICTLIKFDKDVSKTAVSPF